MTPAWSQLRHEAVDLIQRSRRLVDKRHAEDREEAAGLERTIDAAVAGHDQKVLAEAVLRREPGIDFQTAQAAGLDSLDDDRVLRLAAGQDRILVSHDKRTLPGRLAAFVAAGGRSPGVLLVIPRNAPVVDVVEALLLIWTDNRPDDWVNVVAKIPF